MLSKFILVGSVIGMVALTGPCYRATIVAPEPVRSQAELSLARQADSNATIAWTFSVSAFFIALFFRRCETSANLQASYEESPGTITL